MSKRDAAVTYARIGLKVIQLYHVVNGACTCSKGSACPSAGKHPIGNNWYADATDDTDRVAAMWAHNPDANIGVVPGACGHSVADCDVKRGQDGVTYLAGTHEHVGGPASRTPSGGVHRWFRKTPDDPPTTSQKAAGFDWISTTYQVVMPPSATEKGVYRWTQGGAPAPTPPQLIQRIREAQDARGPGKERTYGDAPAPPAYDDTDVIQGIELNTPKGERSEALWGLALTLLERGHTGAQTLATILNTIAGAEKAQDASGPGWMWRYCVWPAAEELGGYDPASDKVRGAPSGFQDEGQETHVPAPGGVFADWAPELSAPPTVVLEPMPLLGIDSEVIEPPRFVIPGWLPRGTMSSLYGKDGVGKTTWVMQEAVQRAAEGQRVVLLLAEDPPETIMWRLKAISEHFCLPSSLWAQNLLIPKLMDQDVKWMTFNRDGSFVLTPFAEAAIRMIVEFRADWFAADPISDIYEDEENIRHRVSPFVRSFNRLCFAHDIGGVMLGHPAKAAESEYSGSGAWSSKVRSRMLMSAEKVHGVETVRWAHHKASYGPKLEDRLFVRAGAVLQVTTVDAAEEITAGRKDELRSVVIDGLRALVASGNVGSAAATSPTSLWKLLVQYGHAAAEDQKLLQALVGDMIREGTLVSDCIFDGNEGRPKVLRSNRMPRSGVWLNTTFAIV